MLEIFRQKVIRLVRGEDGVALVVTLALFMMLYVSCAGVFAVGRAVKERIILQNAADAAAYSAAVVEADILSRIATINRAMAWKYWELVNSQRNCVACSFFNDSHEAYQKDLDENAKPGQIKASLDPGTPLLTVRLSSGSLANELNWKNDEFDKTVKDNGEQVGDFEDKVAECSGQIAEMKEAVDELIGQLSSSVRQAAIDALRANLPSRLGELSACLVSEIKTNDCFVAMKSTQENMFLGFLKPDENVDLDLDVEWYELEEAEGVEGFLRKFTGAFKSSWFYDRKEVPYTAWIPNSLESDEVKGGWNELARDGYRVVPRILSEAYFPGADHEAKGAISVSIAKRNVNPWGDLFGKTLEELVQGGNFGLHDVFSHAQANDWTIVLASAQAGYQGRDAEPGKRQYSLEWKDDQNGQWNLSTDDWDALFIPVRKAFPSAGEDNSLCKWLKDGTWKTVRDDITLAQLGGLDASQFDELNKLQLPRMHKGSESGRLDWDNSDFLDLIQH